MFKKLVPYVYLLRVPILLGLALMAFPILSVFPTPLESLFENLFDLGIGGTFLTAYVAVIAAWSLVLTTRLVLLNGAARFGTAQVGSAAGLSSKKVLWAIVLALPAILAQFVRIREFGHTDIAIRAAAILGGIAAAYITAYLGLLLAVLAAPRGTQDAVDTFPAPRFLIKILKRANQADLLGGFWAKVEPRLLRWPEFLRAGYLDPATGFPLSGHWLAFAFGTITFMMYAAIDFLKIRPALKGENGVQIPAFFFVVWLILNMNWFLSFWAFLFDRIRIPLTLVFAVIAFLAAQVPSNDHYFTIKDGATPAEIEPRDVLKNRLEKNPKIVLVATAGGGIQAAAWTAQVLTGLQSDSLGKNNGQPAWSKTLAESLALISAVSGGATGSMFFLNHYDKNGFTAQAGDFQKIIDDASGPSLDDIAWALVYHDITRLVWPFSAHKLLDRGLMLEQSWRLRGNIQGNLSQWRDGVLEGRRPVAIFNSTLVETGVPLLLATGRVKQSSSGGEEFFRSYSGHDIPVVTAVRLAATFPYVSPAARADLDVVKPHAVDGGYYDTPAVSSLVMWLFETVTKDGREPDMLIVQIVPFPDDKDKPLPSHGGFWQLIAPLDGLFAVRSGSQRIRDDDDLRRLTNRWPKIKVAKFQFNAEGAPLSWQMNKKQKDEIQAQWNATLNGPSPNHESLEYVRCYFNPEHCAKK